MTLSSLHENQVEKSRNKEVRDLFQSGLGCHHAGMLRADRGLTERAFEDGAIKVWTYKYVCMSAHVRQLLLFAVSVSRCAPGRTLKLAIFIIIIISSGLCIFSQLSKFSVFFSSCSNFSQLFSWFIFSTEEHPVYCPFATAPEKSPSARACGGVCIYINRMQPYEATQSHSHIRTTRVPRGILDGHSANVYVYVSRAI